MANEKRCTKCDQVKPMEAFSRHAKAKDGRNWACKACRGAQNAAWYGSVKESHNDKTRAYYHANKEKRLDHIRAYQKENADKIRTRQRAYLLKRQYGLSVADYEALVAANDNGCRVCGDPNGRTLPIDHDHDLDYVRGILCDPCNQVLGLVKDDPERLRALAEYLERARSWVA